MVNKVAKLSIVFLLIFSFVLQAQMRMSPAERTKQMTEQLKLTKEQAKKVESILTKSQEKISKVMDGGFGNPENREKMMKLRDEANDEIMKILDDKQKKEFKKNIEEQRKRMEERRQNRMN